MKDQYNIELQSVKTQRYYKRLNTSNVTIVTSIKEACSQAKLKCTELSQA